MKIMDQRDYKRKRMGKKGRNEDRNKNRISERAEERNIFKVDEQ